MLLSRNIHLKLNSFRHTIVADAEEREKCVLTSTGAFPMRICYVIRINRLSKRKQRKTKLLEERLIAKSIRC